MNASVSNFMFYRDRPKDNLQSHNVNLKQLPIRIDGGLVTK